MAEHDVYLVHLRRPNLKNPNEQRDDPYYEFGSFGCTRCHSRNLFNPRNAAALDGARLAFMQGGRPGFRLVLITPPITIKPWPDRCEARWSVGKKRAKPFKYEKAPVLAYNHGSSDFPLLEKFVRQTARSTIEAKLSSRFRACAQPLRKDIAQELINVYERLRLRAKSSDLTWAYCETLPTAPPKIDRNREKTYRQRLLKLNSRPKGLVRSLTDRRGCRT